MANPVPEGVTDLLEDWQAGDPRAQERLISIVYDELRRLAHHYLQGEGSQDVLQTTALVHEAYLRLVGLDVEWKGRHHFFGLAAQLMRNVLVDYARRRRADKRGGGVSDLALDEVDIVLEPATDLVALALALCRLERVDPRKSKLLELRYFGGLTIAEAAACLSVSHATVERDLKLARAWLVRDLKTSRAEQIRARRACPLARDRGGFPCRHGTPRRRA